MNPPDLLPPPVETGFHGARQAAILGTALIVALALVAAVRWSGDPAAEQIVQVPAAAAAPTPTPRPEVFAPDPGDTP